jgi:PST family polysaccharide transporter
VSAIRDRLAKGAVWSLVSRASVNLISLVSTFILARLLTPEDFGLVALATTMLAVISSITDLSLANALIQHKDPQDDHFHSAWTLGILRSLIVGIGFAAAALPIANAYDDPRLLNVMLALALSAALTGMSNPKTIIFSRNLTFHQDFILQLSQKVVGFAVAVIVALITRSYWALVLSAIASQAANILVSYLLLPYRPRFRLTHTRELFSFSLWLTAGQVLNTINWRADYLLIGTYVGRPALGYYSVGDNLASLPTREAIMPITKVLFPGLARLAFEPDRLRSAYLSAQALMTAIALPIGVGFALCAEPLVRLALGATWAPVIPVIQGLSAIFALQTLSGGTQALMMALGQTRKLFFRDLMSFVIRIPLIVLGMVVAGLQGVIIARMVTGLIAIAINLYLVKETVNVTMWRQLSLNGRAMASVVVMAIAVAGVQTFFTSLDTSVLIAKLAISIAVGAFTYGLCTYLLWTLQGRPKGPEAEALRGLRAVFAQFAKSRPETAS